MRAVIAAVNVQFQRFSCSLQPVQSLCSCRSWSWKRVVRSRL